MNNIYKVLFGFLLCWMTVIALSYLTSSNDMNITERIMYSGVFALIILFVCWIKLGKNGTVKKNNNGKKTVKHKNVDLYVFSGEFGRTPVYRIQNGKIYKGFSNKHDYEIKGDKIYITLSSKWVYRIEGNLIYRGFDKQVTYRIEKNKVYEGEFGYIPVFRISSSVKG